MATDQNNLLDQILQGQELLDGIRNEMPNFDDRVCRVRDVTSISGTIPYLAAKDTMGENGGAQAPGSEPDESNFNLSSLSYDCVQYGRKVNVPKAIVVDVNQYMDALNEMARTLMEQNAIAREADLAALMTDSSANGQQAVITGAWSLATSTPVLDILTLKKNKLPKVDTCVIGATSALELATHADIAAMAGIGYASGAGVPTSALQDIVGSLLGIPASRVFIWETFYNSANYGQTTVLARVTGDFFWAGMQKGLIKTALKGMQGNLSLIEQHTSYSQAVTDTCDFVRGEVLLGAELTGL
jgi:hypothetical protein